MYVKLLKLDEMSVRLEEIVSQSIVIVTNKYVMPFK